MKKVIIGIHGLSNKPEKTILENWWINAMNEGLEKVNSELELPEFELVYWADALYDKPMSQNHDDKDHDLYLHEPYISADKGFQPSEISKRKKLYDFILEQLNKIFLNEDYTLNYSFLTDAIMSRFFEDLDVYYTEKCYLNEKEKCQASDLIKSRMENSWPYSCYSKRS